MLWIITGIIISYFLGSIPTAYIFGRLIKGVDIREYGSGNVGATNALRVLGKGAGISVLVLDILKGFVAVFFLGDIISAKAAFIGSEIMRIILGLSCISGHNWTIFLGFKGGKGMATTLGVLLGLAMKLSGLKIVLALTVLIWLLTFSVTKIVSLASLISAITLPVLMAVFRLSYTIIFAGLILSAFIILRHKSNLKRILTGKEPRITFKPKNCDTNR